MDDIKNQLDSYYGLGVRTLFPVHLFDNAFSGAAVYDERFDVGNKKLPGQWFNVRDCSSEGIEFRFQGRNDPLTSVATTVFGLDPAPPYPGNGHGNTVGLSPLCD